MLQLLEIPRYLCFLLRILNADFEVCLQFCSEERLLQLLRFRLQLLVHKSCRLYACLNLFLIDVTRLATTNTTFIFNQHRLWHCILQLDHREVVRKIFYLGFLRALRSALKGFLLYLVSRCVHHSCGFYSSVLFFLLLKPLLILNLHFMLLEVSPG